MYRILKVFYYNFLRNSKKKIKSLQIDVTHQCNLRCKGCYHFQDEFHKDKSLDYWENIFKKYKKNNIFNIWLYGGEPTLRMDLIELAYKYFPLVYVITNGIIPISKKYKNIRIYVSLDGKKDYNDFYRGPNVFNKIIENYFNDKRVVFNTTITKNNISHIKYLINLVKKTRIHGIGFQFYSESSNSRTEIVENNTLTNQDFSDCEKILSQYYKNNHVFVTKYLLACIRNQELTLDNCYIKNYIDCYYADGTKKRCCTPGVDCRTCKILPPYFHYVLDKNKDIKTYIKFLSWL